MQILIKLFITITAFGLLQSCSTSLDSVQKSNKTVQQLYQQGNYKNSTNAKRTAIGNNSGFVRVQQNELENRFPTLANPILNMFVFPHLVNNSHPIPGYTTNFNMYKENHYALPSEIY